MFQELTSESGAAWAIASMFFFLGVWLVVTVQLFRTRPEVMKARARLVLEGEPGKSPAAPPDAGTTA
jgi:hypothetical protein